MLCQEIDEVMHIAHAVHHCCICAGAALAASAFALTILMNIKVRDGHSSYAGLFHYSTQQILQTLSSPWIIMQLLPQLGDT